MKAFVLDASTAHTVHLAFEWLALALGFQLYRWQRRLHDGPRAADVLQPGAFSVVAGCIAGAALGNKLAFWLEVPQLWSGFSAGLLQLLAGQSIVGGLLGGLVGVEIGKKIGGIQRSTGDNFVLPIMLGTAVGRIGCFLSGLHDGTFGNPSSLPWAMDFGDGIARHPTQLYDIAFVLAWGGALVAHRARFAHRPGLLFKLYLAGYLLWRLLVDGIKPVPFVYPLGLSGIQWLCLLALVVYVPLLVRQLMEEPDDNTLARR